jgi:hypothetical protein
MRAMSRFRTTLRISFWRCMPLDSLRKKLNRSIREGESMILQRP